MIRPAGFHVLSPPARPRGAGPASTALAMVTAVPSDSNSSAVAMATSLLKGLPEAATARALLEAQGDNKGRRLAAQTCLESALRNETPRQQVLAGLQAVPPDLTTTRGNLVRAGADFLGDATLRSALQAVSENSAAYPLALAWLEACERGESPVQAARAALSAVPSDYPSSRARAAGCIFAGLDAPVARMATTMTAQGVDSTAKWAVYESALDQLSGGEPASLAQAALAMLRAIPSDYATSQKNAALASAHYLCTVYSDPAAVGALQQARNYQGVLAALETCKALRSDRQMVEDLARAVTAQDQTQVIEQRGGMLVVGGTRVKVREAGQEELSR